MLGCPILASNFCLVSWSGLGLLSLAISQRTGIPAVYYQTHHREVGCYKHICTLHLSWDSLQPTSCPFIHRNQLIWILTMWLEGIAETWASRLVPHHLWAILLLACKTNLTWPCYTCTRTGACTHALSFFTACPVAGPHSPWDTPPTWPWDTE